MSQREFQRVNASNDSHWTLCLNSSPASSLLPNSDALYRNSASSRFPPIPPQAKGRIERAWRTCQDRLVSELRLARVATLEQANAPFTTFCADYNQRFARPAAHAACDFRSLPRRFELTRCLSLHYQRVAVDHTIILGAHSITLPPLAGQRAMPEKPFPPPINWMALCALSRGRSPSRPTSRPRTSRLYDFVRFRANGLKVIEFRCG